MGSYPVVLDLTDRPCVVIGGGLVAQSKVQGLLEAGARVTMVSQEITPTLEEWVVAGRVSWVARPYRGGDLAGFFLAYAATGDQAVSEAVAREGRERGVWVNAADDPERCDFTLPSVLRRGRLVVAVSTGGASPALARAVRERLESQFGEQHAELVERVASLRRELRQAGHSPDAQAWREALALELDRLSADEGPEGTVARLREALEARACR
jgi:siroheme synthase-like protein